MATEPNDALRIAESRYNEGPLTPRKTKAIERLLEKAAAEGRTDAEIKALEAILTLCDYLNLWNGVGKKGVEAAEREIGDALAINPRLAAAYYARGFVERTKGNHENALAAFQKSLEIEPDNPRAIAQEGAEQLYLGHPERALSAVRRAIELGPNHPARGMFCWIGARAEFFDGHYAEAISWLEQSIKTWSDLWYSLAYNVSAHALIGDKEKASQKLEAFIRQFPKLNSVARIIEAERTNPNKNPFVVAGRQKFHEGLAIAGLPRETPGNPTAEPPAAA
jgi:tetratricopeptide (TPR) repeat protein